MRNNAFTVTQTHGILEMPVHSIEVSSSPLGWSSLFVSQQRERAYESRFKASDDHLIIVHRDGPVRVQRDLSGDRQDKVVQPGGLFVLPAGRDFGVRLGGDLSTIHLYVRSAYIREAAREITDRDPSKVEIIPRLGEHDCVIENTARLACEMAREQVRSEWTTEALARTLAVQLVRRHSTFSGLMLPTVDIALSQKRLRAVDQLISDRLADKITLADMANAAALSPIHFARQFKKATGQSPHQYLLAARVETAKRLLGMSLSISEISFRCGFSHQEHLTRVFGKSVGLTPAAYRRTLRE